MDPPRFLSFLLLSVLNHLLFCLPFPWSLSTSPSPRRIRIICIYIYIYIYVCINICIYVCFNHTVLLPVACSRMCSCNHKQRAWRNCANGDPRPHIQLQIRRLDFEALCLHPYDISEPYVTVLAGMTSRCVVRTTFQYPCAFARRPSLAIIARQANFHRRCAHSNLFTNSLPCKNKIMQCVHEKRVGCLM